MVPMAKKKSHKKQTFKYAQPVANTSIAAPLASSPNVAKTPSVVSTTTMDVNPYLGGDLLRLATVGGSLIVSELALWALFTHSSVGAAVYNLYKIGS